VRALNIQEERSLAGRVAGLMYVVGAAIGGILLVLPGVPTTHWRVTLAAGCLSLVWGVLRLVALDRERVHPVFSHLSCSLGYPLIGVVAATTGGANSPARFFLFFTIFYVAYFYPVREALPHFALCLGVEALPLLYDGQAVADGLVGELVVVGAIYAILGGLILSGKQLLVQLRETERALSLLDPLTELPNRRALMNRLAELAEGAGAPRERGGDTVGFVLIDVDHFKSANTAYGHPGGDRVLVETGRALASVARKDDMVARLGGDEFAIVCPGMTPSGLAEFGMRVLRALREADKALDMPEFRLTASVGSALFPRDAESPELLLEAADRRMRNAKFTGRDRAVAA
jgi:diguanylate cyclase (GGDEF)-like protein